MRPLRKKSIPCVGSPEGTGIWSIGLFALSVFEERSPWWWTGFSLNIAVIIGLIVIMIGLLRFMRKLQRNIDLNKRNNQQNNSNSKKPLRK